MNCSLTKETVTEKLHRLHS